MIYDAYDTLLQNIRLEKDTFYKHPIIVYECNILFNYTASMYICTNRVHNVYTLSYLLAYTLLLKGYYYKFENNFIIFINIIMIGMVRFS